MFAARMFPPRYFAPRYFAEVGGDAVPLPIDVPDGLRDRFLATEGTSWVVGGMTEGLIAERTGPEYYISFFDTTSFGIYSTYHASYMMEFVFQFDCFAPSRHEARLMADLLVDIYHPGADNILTDAGLILGMSAMPGGGMADEGSISKQGRRLYKFSRDFTFTVRKSRTIP